MLLKSSHSWISSAIPTLAEIINPSPTLVLVGEDGYGMGVEVPRLLVYSSPVLSILGPLHSEDWQKAVLLIPSADTATLRTIAELAMGREVKVKRGTEESPEAMKERGAEVLNMMQVEADISREHSNSLRDVQVKIENVEETFVPEDTFNGEYFENLEDMKIEEDES